MEADGKVIDNYLIVLLGVLIYHNGREYRYIQNVHSLKGSLTITFDLITLESITPLNSPVDHKS